MFPAGDVRERIILMRFENVLPLVRGWTDSCGHHVDGSSLLFPFEMSV
jgi:hypothetical protein